LRRLCTWGLAVCVAAVVPVCGVRAAEEADDASASADSGVRVVEKLLAARSNLTPLQADFYWVIGPVGVDQQTFGGRLYILDTKRYRVDFEAFTASGSGGRLFLMVPDGRWAYQFSDNPNLVGMRVDLDLVKRKVRSPAPRIRYDPTGGALLELLRFRGYVTYEGDEELSQGRCAVLSYQGASMRASLLGGQSAKGDAGLRTRLRYRWADGLLVQEEEVDEGGQQQSSYRVSNIEPVQPTEGLLKVPEGIRCVDVSKQLVRRILYGPPRPVPSPIRPSSESKAQNSQR